MTLVPKDSLAFREYGPADKNFVYSTWLRSYKFLSYFAKRIKHNVYFKGQQTLVDHLLNKKTTKVLIAHPKDDAETILGFLCFEPGEMPVVHFMFIKETFRKMGVATALFKCAEIDPNKMTFTHWTMPVDELIKKFPEMTYDPYKL